MEPIHARHGYLTRVGCRQCGTFLDSRAQYCHECGTRFVREEEQAKPKKEPEADDGVFCVLAIAFIALAVIGLLTVIGIAAGWWQMKILP